MNHVLACGWNLGWLWLFLRILWWWNTQETVKKPLSLIICFAESHVWKNGTCESVCLHDLMEWPHTNKMMIGNIIPQFQVPCAAWGLQWLINHLDKILEIKCYIDLRVQTCFSYVELIAIITIIIISSTTLSTTTATAIATTCFSIWCSSFFKKHMSWFHLFAK